MTDAGVGSGGGEGGPKVLREIADSCRRQQWSIAIRLLTSLPNLSSEPILLCNRALCYSKLELHKHVLKDCNKALVLDSWSLQAYLYKGQAMVAMGKQEEGSLIWQRGYEAGLTKPCNLQMVLQLHSLATQSISPTDRVNPREVMPTSGPVQAEDFVMESSKKIIRVSTGEVNRTEGGDWEKHQSNQAPINPRKVTATSSPVQAEDSIIETSKKVVRVSTGEVTPMEGTDWGKQLSNQAPPSLVVNISLARGIVQVNAGNYEEAVRIFTQLIKENPGLTGALVGRGTAYAFQRKLETAIDDFTKAIELDPSAVEAWKRRGQAKAAVGSSLEAIDDLSKALVLQPTASDTLYERGVIYYKLKDFQSAIEDIQHCLTLAPTNRYAHNYHGLALTATGEYVDGMAAHIKAIELDPSMKEAWTHLAKLHKELGDSEQALNCVQHLLSMDDKYIHAYLLKGLLLFSLGDHRGAAKELTTGLEMEPHNSDFRYLRGSCYHAIGNYAEAVQDYDEVLDADPVSGESRVESLQFLSFYQRETALYMVSKRNEPFKGWDIDKDLDPFFKEAWCKRRSPLVLFPAYKIQPFPQDLFSDGHVTPADGALTKSRRILLEAADRLGRLIQYNCPGFLKNVRQHRMAGLAVLEIAQKVATAFAGSRIVKAEELPGIESGENRQGNILEEGIQNFGGVWDSRSNIHPPSFAHEGDHKCGQRLNWRELYSIAVKWRQASEPCDPVVWVDMLSEKEYAAGFGSHTPLLLGQARVVRYYPNFPRAFVVAKGLILAQGNVYNTASKLLDLSDPMKLQAVDAAANCREIYDVIGEDFWLVTPCHSTTTQGKVLDGTRFTLQKSGINGYDFSIRTPCTPPRWADYDKELTAAWEEYCNLYCERNRSADDSQLLQQFQDCILRLSFYWYNFMPLARGTAVVGYVMLLGLFLAADMEITASIPEGMQVDWEAILSPDPELFMEAVRPWLYPSVKMDTSWRNLPIVSESFGTFGSAIAALSSHY